MRPNQHGIVVGERRVAVPCCYGSLALWPKREQPPRWRSRRHGSGGDAGVFFVMGALMASSKKRYGCHLLTLTR
jgi:hypothetical protein